MSDYKLYRGDCLEIMKEIPNDSIDMVLADLPYGTTACDWDSIISLDKLWTQYKRIGKDDTAFVFTATQPFTTNLINSNKKGFCYEWIWNKKFGANFVQAKRQPLKTHENILVFSQDGSMPNYYPEMIERDEPIKKGGNKQSKAVPIARTEASKEFSKKQKVYDKKHPTTLGVLNFSVRKGRGDHPTQKPVALFEYLIKTYTNEGDTVLDNVMGSGTTGVACQKTDRKFLGIEQDEEYFEVAKQRIEEAKNTDWEKVEAIEEWQEFDGIGEKTAKVIYEEFGKVENTEFDELIKIDGIGKKTLDRIKSDD
jgi:site-specific DNA-methyltransferase (adenine-specific)